MTFGPAQAGGDAIALIREADQFSSSLDRDAELFEPLDQKPLMLVLGEDLEEGIGRQVRADRRERQARNRLAFHPEVDSGNLVASLHNGVGEVELSVEFEGPRLNRQGPRGGPGLGRLVDDAHLGAKLGQPERQHQTRRTSADDQYIAASHSVLRNHGLSRLAGSSLRCRRRCADADLARPPRAFDASIVEHVSGDHRVA
jgi:hypothetical protein